MSEIIYRPAILEDLPTIKEYYTDLVRIYQTVGYKLQVPENVEQLWLESFQRTLGKYSQVFIAEQDGKILGFGLGRLRRLAPYQGGSLVGDYADLYIIKEARRLGLSKKLNELMIQWFKDNGATSVEGQVLYKNDPSRQMLEAIGFKIEIIQMRLEL
ncbi:MAG: GNAT family N-acetyltransferase [Anaerolineaceae bacterium]|nr:GNAT family N-acetyltransferase [Anaerolineaceae bacterium]